jgi:Concanavalin A-like lectin/glucanases superfamily/Immunoglobulin I-set domain
MELKTLAPVTPSPCKIEKTFRRIPWRVQIAKWSAMLLLAALGTVASFAACTETIAVTSLDDAGPGTLRQAIEDANACPGTNFITFTVTGAIVLETELPHVEDALFILGPGPASLTVTRSTNVATDCFSILSLEDINIAWVSGLTITNGCADSGAGVFCNGNAVLSNCVITANFGERGGYGAGAYNLDTLLIIDCSISGNFGRGNAFLGAGVMTEGTSLTIINSVLGGNHTPGLGGGLTTLSGSVALTNVTLSGNVATNGGGGLMLLGFDTFVAASVTIVSNRAEFGGGGVYDDGNGTAEFKNTIIAGNEDPSTPDIDGDFVSLGFNLIGNGFTDGVDGNQVGSAATPLDPVVGPLQNNGGPTATHALLTSSPAINAGTNDLAPPTDQRGPGFPRIIGGVIDIGAFEFTPSGLVVIGAVNSTNCAGSQAVFSVTASGVGALSYQWTHAGTNLADATNATLMVDVQTNAQAGEYCVIVSDQTQTLTNCATLVVLNSTVPDGNGPEDVTICAGSNAMFCVTVTNGAPMPIYEWLKDGTLLAGQTNDCLLLTNVTSLDAGQYCVRLRNGLCGGPMGPFVERCATLRVLPFITATPPVNVAVSPGQDALFQTTVSGADSNCLVTLAWYKDGALLPGQTNDSLLLTNVTGADAGGYCVVAQGCCNAVTNCAALALLSNCSNPVVQINSGSAGICELPPLPAQIGNPAHLVAANGSPDSYIKGTLSNVPAGYLVTNGMYLAWCVDYHAEIFHGANYRPLMYLSTGSLPAQLQNPNWPFINYILNHKQGNAVDVQNAIWFFIGGPAPSYDPTYFPPSVHATNMVSDALLNGAGFIPLAGQITAVILDSGPHVQLLVIETRCQESLERCPGGQIAFCASATGTPPLTLQWLKDGLPIPDATNACLNLTNLTSSDGGAYCIVASNACGSATNCTALTMFTNASLTPLVNLVRAPGESATFSVTPGGTGPFTFLWRRNGSLLAGQNGSSLTIPSVSVADAGLYTVEVFGHCGTAMSSGELFVTAPLVLSGPNSLSRVVGESAQFSVSAAGTPPFLYQWQHEGTNLPGASNSVLLLPSVSVADAGTYCVSVTDNFGSATACATLQATPLLPPSAACLISHWSFDESSGNTAFDDADGNDGTLNNNPARVAGRFGGGLRFNGANQYVQVPSAENLRLTNNFSLSFWFNPSVPLSAASGRKDLVKKFGSYWVILNYPGSDGRLAFVLNNGVPLAKSATTSWHPNQWYHAAATYDGAALRLYVNGMLEGTAAASGLVSTNESPVQFGGNTEQGYWFPGGLDEARFYRCALTDGEVRALFLGAGTTNSPPGTSSPPTITALPSLSIPEDTTTGPIAFVVGDVETSSSNLFVTAWSSNPSLVPDARLFLGGADSNRTLTILPAFNCFGSADITVTVVDDFGSATTTVFTLTVTPVNDSPAISDLANQVTVRNQMTPALAFSIGDLETPAAALTVTATSGNQALVADADILLGGAGPIRTIQLTPALNQIGSALITVTVSDGVLSASDTFTLTVLDTPADTNVLISHWQFEEASGSTALDSAGPNPGALVGPTRAAAGRIGAALCSMASMISSARRTVRRWICRTTSQSASGSSPHAC